MGTETLELGGNILLTGFSELDSSELVVIKKIVGQFAKKLSERPHGLKQLSITAETGGKKQGIVVLAETENGELEGSSTDSNLYYALTEALQACGKQSS